MIIHVIHMHSVEIGRGFEGSLGNNPRGRKECGETNLGYLLQQFLKLPCLSNLLFFDVFCTRHLLNKFCFFIRTNELSTLVEVENYPPGHWLFQADSGW